MALPKSFIVWLRCRESFNAGKAFLLYLTGTAAVLWLHGYHPYADDAAIYVAGIKHLAYPGLYSRQDMPFLEVQGRLSLFEIAVASIARNSGIRVEWLLFGIYLSSIILMFHAASKLSGLLFRGAMARLMSVIFVTAAFTLPIAGTALSVMDPYVTSRTMTTPLTLLALCAMVEQRARAAILLTVATCALHPLMGLGLILFQVVYSCWSRGREYAAVRAAFLFGALFMGALCISAYSAEHPVSAAYRSIVLTRSYLFLGKWAWYEYLGLILPLSIFTWVWRKNDIPEQIRDLAAVAVLCGGASVAVCAILVHPSGSMFLARLQLLRIFTVIYLVGLVMLAGWAALVFKKDAKAIILLPLAIAVGTSIGQRETYRERLNIEWPSTQDPNEWNQAFAWIRNNSDQHAIFAGDPNLMELDGEGHEGFRAAAERAILADNKDGGVAALSPALADEWTRQHAAQLNLGSESDAERIAHLRPFNVNWLLLPPGAQTRLMCPFQNQSIKVCRLS